MALGVKLILHLLAARLGFKISQAKGNLKGYSSKLQALRAHTRLLRSHIHALIRDNFVITHINAHASRV